MSYNVKIKTFTNGSITFDATAAGVYQESGSADGPVVIDHIERNDAGAIVDLDGTGVAGLAPPRIKYSLRFLAAHPAGHTQYNNLIALKGHYGTFVGVIPTAAGETTKTAYARLMDVKATWRGRHKTGQQSYMMAEAEWQLEAFF